MHIEVHYGGRNYAVAHNGDNINQLREVGHYVAGGQAETLTLELEDGGTLICVVGPSIPFAVTYRD